MNEIKCRLIEFSEEEEPQPGDMYYTKMFNCETHLFVILPNGAKFNLTSAKRLWEVTGEPPQITVTPSIQTEGNFIHKPWHGFLTDGILQEV
jgi:hypothetical protein